MKKQRFIGLLVCLLLLLAAGCSSSKTASGDKAGSNTPSAEQQSGAVTGKATANSNSAGQSGQAPGQGQKSALLGKVTAINGTQITVQLAQMPDRTGAAPSQERPANPPGEQGSNPARPDQDKNAAGPEQGQAPTMTFSNESKTLTIPTTAKITSGRGESAREISLTDIKVGDVLQVRFQEGKSDNASIESVIVMQSGQ